MTHLYLVLAMMVVTYLPRVAPLVLLRQARLPVFLQRYLKVLPVCALGALLFPGAIGSIPDEPLAAIGGMVIAGIVSLTRGGLLLSVVAGVGTAYLLLLI